MDENGYQEVRTPQLYQKTLWEKSGHLAHYEDNMFATGDNMLFKPMNCPGHVQIFNASTVSHKQLPIRMAEFGCCHRNEPSGALNGMFRVRQFVQDDAHIFCKPDQIEEEIADFCQLLDKAYKQFGFADYSVAISLRPNDRAGDDELWDRAEADLIRVVEGLGIPYKLLPGEGAFYGPKLEFALRDNLGREWQCGTAQLDFILPARLDARYAGDDGRVHTPVMIHRAILGSIERFIAILLEHHAGRLPDWLSPVQVVIMQVGDPEASKEWLQAIRERLNGYRVLVDDRAENLMQKVKEHSESLIPNIIVIGGREAEQELISLRRLGSKPETVKLDTLVSLLK